MKKILTIAALALCACCASGVCAEEVRFFENCKYCPVTIHYSDNEAREILGGEGLKQVAALPDFSDITIKIDLDGMMKNGSRKDPDAGYELRITGFRDKFYVTHLGDGSYFNLRTDHESAKQTERPEKWLPEIDLYSKHDPIKAEDDTPEAWEKFRKTEIYKWVDSADKEKSWKEKLGKRFHYVLGLLLEAKK